MPNSTQSKKAAHPDDWHRADIKAALEKAGWSLRRLSLHHGYCAGTLMVALGRPYPRAERLIARAIGRRPQEIWPSRYDSRGRSLVEAHERKRRKQAGRKAWATRCSRSKSSTTSTHRNGNERRAA